MADREIREALQKGELRIEGFDESCLQGTSYDARIGLEVHVSNSEHSVQFNEQTKTITIRPGEFGLLVTHEKFTLPLNIAANIGPKTYFTRKGLILLAGLQIDPGFSGALALAVYNSSPRSIALEHMQEICTIQFLRLSEPATKAPPVNKDLQVGRIPRLDKDYFRDLETQSLTQIGKDLQQLAINVNELTRIVDSLSKSVDKMEKNLAGLHRLWWGLTVAIGAAVFSACMKLLFAG